MFKRIASMYQHLAKEKKAKEYRNDCQV